ncbi:MRN complex-interacting protein-like [Teleopsis dalmanni]|uniref:MRN complex-interacting protein-like n=1 Tax=Teleopsis dalmanni TaxID=139649 RepID=UPI0018CD5731|nr:MRN complex-interacting protein-like [Teleopsis dalmanni]
MPQEIRVVLCFDCNMYQVDIVKKINKWQCKLCGAKQSLKKEFYRGSGGDCRLKAQELNMDKGRATEEVENEVLEFLQSDDIDFIAMENSPEDFLGQQSQQENSERENKWSCYVDETNTNSDFNTSYCDTTTFHGNQNATEASFSSKKRRIENRASDLSSSCKKNSKWNDYL